MRLDKLLAIRRSKSGCEVQEITVLQARIWDGCGGVTPFHNRQFGLYSPIQFTERPIPWGSAAVAKFDWPWFNRFSKVIFANSANNRSYNADGPSMRSLFKTGSKG